MRLIEVKETDRRKIQELELEILKEIDRICNLHNIKYSVAYGTMLGAVRHKGFIPWDDDVDILMMRSDYIRFGEICKTELNEQRFFYQTNATDGEYYYLFDKVRLNNTVFKESFVSKYNIHHGVYIDIFPIDNLPNSIWKQTLQYYSFHFFRTGVQSKYLMLGARSGSKRFVFTLLHCLYFLFPIKWLYKMAHKVAMRYDKDKDVNKVICFFGAYKKRDIYDAHEYEKYNRCIFENIEVNILAEYDSVLKQLYGNYMKLPPVEKRDTKHTITEIKI